MDKIAAVAEHDFRFEWQLPEQFSTERCSRSRFANDKRACSTHIHDIVVAQFSCEDAWAKRPVPANIDTPEENNESHTATPPGPSSAGRLQHAVFALHHPTHVRLCADVLETHIARERAEEGDPEIGRASCRERGGAQGGERGA